MSPVEKGWLPQVGKWEGGPTREGRVSWCLSFWNGHRPFFFPRSLPLLMPASPSLLGLYLPLTCLLLSLVSPNRPAPALITPGLHTPQPQISPSPLNPVGTQWPPVLAQCILGSLTSQVHDLLCVEQVSIISRNCLVIGSGKKNCSLTGQGGKCDVGERAI